MSQIEAQVEYILAMWDQIVSGEELDSESDRIAVFSVDTLERIE